MNKNIHLNRLKQLSQLILLNLRYKKHLHEFLLIQLEHLYMNLMLAGSP